MDKAKILASLAQIFEQYHVASSDILESLQHFMTPIKIMKRASIFQQGDLLSNIYFLPEGVVRYFVLSSTGKEVTKSLRIGPAFVCSTYAMSKNQKAPFTAEALHDLTVFAIPLEKWYRLIDENPAFSKFYIRLLEDLFIIKEQSELSLLQDSPEIRYQKFHAQYIDYLNVIPQWMIATCLGITPEALSRLRKRKQ